MTIEQLKADNNSKIRVKTLPNSITRDEVADSLDSLADEQLLRGVKVVANTTELQALSGADHRNVIVAENGFYKWESSGTANGTDIFAATGGGVYVRKFSKNPEIEDITYANLVIKINASTLVPGKKYKITDRGDRGIILTGVSSNKISIYGERTMLCPKSYAIGSLDGNSWKGVWHSTKTVSINDLMIWGGLVWKNLTGSIGSATSNKEAELDAVNWILIPKSSFTNSEYVEMIFRVDYDIEHDWISKQFDDNGNEFGCSYEHYNKFAFSTRIGSVNPVDLCDWNYQTYGSNVSISNNKCIAVTNNVEGITIYGNTLGSGFIRRNKMNYVIANNVICNKTTSTTLSSLLNTLYNNTCTGNIISNFISGTIDSNSCGVIASNQGGPISGNAGSGSLTNNNLANISSNTTTGGVYNNISINSISGNRVTGSIYYNSCLGGIYNNYTGASDFVGDIYENTCKSVNNNSGTGNIYNNVNTGTIQGNTLNGYNIYYNTNNGDIVTGTLVADITDPQVNK